MQYVNLEKGKILLELARAGNDMSKAAEELNTSRRTLQNRMRELHIPRVKSGPKKEPLPFKRKRGGKHRGALVLGAVSAVGAAVVVGAIAASKIGGGA